MFFSPECTGRDQLVCHLEAAVARHELEKEGDCDISLATERARAFAESHGELYIQGLMEAGWNCTDVFIQPSMAHSVRVNRYSDTTL